MIAALFLFTLKSVLVLALLYVPYTLLLSQETFFQFNRLVLLSILVLSLVLPCCNISQLSLDHQPIMEGLHRQMIEFGIPVLLTDYPSSQQAVAPASTEISWFQLTSMLYLIGMIFILLLRVVQLARMGLIIQSGSLWKQQDGRITIYCHSDEVVPFSWLNNVVISQSDYANHGREIILHEKGHIVYAHSADILLLTLVQALQWWNPLCYMLGNSLRDVHEYEADDYVLRQGIILSCYQNLLIKKAVGSSSYAFANNFNHSLIKKRIAMMCKKHSNPWMRSKVLIAFPMVAFALCAFATPRFVQPVQEAVNQFAGKVTETVPIEQVSVSESVEPIAAAPVSAPVVIDEVMIKISGKVTGPNMTPLEGVTVTELSSNCSVITDAEGNYTLEVNEAPAHLSFTKKGYGTTNLYIPTESLKRFQDVSVHLAKTDSNKTTYQVVEEQPEYPGGTHELMNYLSTSVKYPEQAFKNGISGRVIVQFVVTEDGSIEECTVVRGVDPELDAEALRVVSGMPKWQPGTVNDQPVRCRFVIPVTFKLQ